MRQAEDGERIPLVVVRREPVLDLQMELVAPPAGRWRIVDWGDGHGEREAVRFGWRGGRERESGEDAIRG